MSRRSRPPQSSPKSKPAASSASPLPTPFSPRIATTLFAIAHPTTPGTAKMTAGDVHTLQRTIGNAAVTRLLQKSVPTKPASVVQRIQEKQAETWIQHHFPKELTNTIWNLLLKKVALANISMSKVSILQFWDLVTDFDVGLKRLFQEWLTDNNIKETKDTAKKTDQFLSFVLNLANTTPSDVKGAPVTDAEPSTSTPKPDYLTRLLQQPLVPSLWVEEEESDDSTYVPSEEEESEEEEEEESEKVEAAPPQIESREDKGKAKEGEEEEEEATTGEAAGEQSRDKGKEIAEETDETEEQAVIATGKRAEAWQAGKAEKIARIQASDVDSFEPESLKALIKRHPHWRQKPETENKQFKPKGQQMIKRPAGTGMTEIVLENFTDPYTRQLTARTVVVEAEVIPGATTGRPGAPEPASNFRVGTSAKVKTRKGASKADTYRNQGVVDAQKGHIIALELGGPDVPKNIVPQWANWQGNGLWRKMEKHVEKMAQEMNAGGNRLKMRVNVYYKSPGSNTMATFRSLAFPTHFMVEVWEIDRKSKEPVDGGKRYQKTLEAGQDHTDDMMSARQDHQTMVKSGQASLYTDSEIGKDKKRKQSASSTTTNASTGGASKRRKQKTPKNAPAPAPVRRARRSKQSTTDDMPPPPPPVKAPRRGRNTTVSPSAATSGRRGMKRTAQTLNPPRTVAPPPVAVSEPKPKRARRSSPRTKTQGQSTRKKKSEE